MAALRGFYLSQFIRHYLNATRVDVLHSPFVFELFQKAIRRQASPASFEAIEQLRQRLKRDATQIHFNDFGAGNEIQPDKTLSVSQIATRHAKPVRIAHLLYHTLRHLGYTNGIELGTSLGLTSAYLALAFSENSETSHFASIEGSEEVQRLAADNLGQLGLDKNITLHLGNFDEQLEPVLKHFDQLDFAFVDGNHTYPATMRYFEQLLPKTHSLSLLVFDDIYWSRDMARAWQEIKQHPQVRVTLDLFFIGLVFFRTGQAKEHFRLRVW